MFQLKEEILKKEEILEKVKELRESSIKENGYNLMGCSELWYDKYYALGQSFTDEELNALSIEELNRLLKLADTIQEGLY